MHLTAAGHDIPTSTTTTTTTTRSAPSEHLAVARANAPSAPGTAPQRKKSKSVKTQPSKQLSKSFSTPQLRGPVMSDSDDKKRNKLGYQRISIACAHCRRRKIRCLMPEDETEQRCQNCIRLKKDCVFYPVDQQAAIDARSETPTKPGGPLTSSTVPSSPSQVAGRSLELAGHPFGTTYQSIPSDVSRGFQGLPIVPSVSIPSQGTLAHPDHGFQSRAGGMAWSPQEYGTQSPAVGLAEASQLQQPFVGYGQPNMTVDTAPFPGATDQSQQNAEQFGYAPAQQMPQQQPWQPLQHHQPMRSQSYPNNYAGHLYSPNFQQSQHPSPYGQVTSFPPNDPQTVVMVPASGSFTGGANPYIISDLRSSSIPNPSAFHPPQQLAWYPGATQYTMAAQHIRTLPSQHDEGE